MDASFERLGFGPADILLPQGCDMQKWSVVACDQYTSEPAYWEEVEKTVGDAPSALRLTLPEVYLSGDDSARIASINKAMEDYLARGLFRRCPRSFVLVERRLSGGRVRRGLVGQVDLEAYDYGKGSSSLIRATEGTVLERIPPRVKVRENAALELPHVMLLADDPGRTVVEPLAARAQGFPVLYDFELMQGGGHVTGRLVAGGEAAAVAESLGALADPAAFGEKYGVKGAPLLLFAVGDGNHSLATAKACWEALKKTLPAEKRAGHPARYALVELVNLHDDALEFEAIHRVVFGAEPEKLLASLLRFYPSAHLGEGTGQRIDFLHAQGRGTITVENPASNLPYGTLQAFLDGYIAERGCRVDYIHGDAVARRLGSEPGNIAFFMPALSKSELFKTVIADGALPRKTFSMGGANEKRFYLEARAIR